MSLIGFSGSTSAELTKSDRITLKQGQSFKAPKAGQFLSSQALAKLLTDHNAKVSTLELRIENLQKKHALELKADTDRKEIDLESCMVQVQALTENCELQKSILNESINRNSQLAERKWYESGWFPFVGGVALCATGVAVGASLN